MSVLSSILMVNYEDRKVVGETCNLVMAGHISSMESITSLLYVLALSKYKPMSRSSSSSQASKGASFSPDTQFMQKCSSLIQNEPVIKGVLAPKILWSLYAMDYGREDQGLLNKLFDTMEKNWKSYGEKDVVTAFRAMAHFDMVSYQLKDNLLKTAISQGSINWSFDSLTEICHCLAQLGQENSTFLDIVCKRINEFVLYSDKIDE